LSLGSQPAEASVVPPSASKSAAVPGPANTVVSSWVITADTSYADQDAPDRRGRVMSEVLLELGGGGVDHPGDESSEGSKRGALGADGTGWDGASRTRLTGRRADGTRYEFVLEDMPPWFGRKRGRDSAWFIKSSLPGDVRRAGTGGVSPGGERGGAVHYTNEVYTERPTGRTRRNAWVSLNTPLHPRTAEQLELWGGSLMERDGEGQGPGTLRDGAARCFLVVRGHQRTSLEQRTVHEADIGRYLK